MAHLEGKARSQYVQTMFGRIAQRYDLMNRLMTFGQDMKWRRFVIKKAGLASGAYLLDLATGTGDIAVVGLEQIPDLRVVGADFAFPMMQVGRKRRGGKNMTWCQADALALPHPPSVFDAVVSGYLLRNVIDLKACLAEQMRVVRPGGMVVALDTSPPPDTLLRPAIEFHLRFVIPTLGRLITSAPDAYEYLPSSTAAFKSPDELAAIMREVGFRNVGWQTFMFGTMAVYWGEKPVN